MNLQTLKDYQEKLKKLTRGPKGQREALEIKKEVGYVLNFHHLGSAEVIMARNLVDFINARYLPILGHWKQHEYFI